MVKTRCRRCGIKFDMDLRFAESHTVNLLCESCRKAWYEYFDKNYDKGTVSWSAFLKSHDKVKFVFT